MCADVRLKILVSTLQFAAWRAARGMWSAGNTVPAHLQLQTSSLNTLAGSSELLTSVIMSRTFRLTCRGLTSRVVPSRHHFPADTCPVHRCLIRIQWHRSLQRNAVSCKQTYRPPVPLNLHFVRADQSAAPIRSLLMRVFMYMWWVKASPQLHLSVWLLPDSMRNVDTEMTSERRRRRRDVGAVRQH